MEAGTSPIPSDGGQFCATLELFAMKQNIYLFLLLMRLNLIWLNLSGYITYSSLIPASVH